MINDNEKKMCFLFCCISVFLLLVIVVIIFQKNKEKYTPLPTPLPTPTSLSNLIKISPTSEFSTTLATGNEISISSSSLSLLNSTTTYTPSSNFPILQCMADGNLLIEINNDATPVLQTNYQTNTMSSGYAIQTINLNTDLIKSVSTLNEIKLNDTLAGGGNEISIMSSYLNLLNPTITYTPSSNFPIFMCQSDGNLLIEINNDATPVLQTNYQTNTMSSGFTIVANITSPSDYRLKQDITPIKNPLERCLKLKPKNYRMISDVEKGNNNECEGFIAHEVQDIIPSAVLGEKDETDRMQSINYSGLTPLLTGSIQELYKIIQNQNQIIEKQGNDIKELYNIIKNKL